jgi:protein TonB
MKHTFLLLMALTAFYGYSQEGDPAGFVIEQAVFPGCENVVKEDRKKCFSQNFREWLAGELPEKVVKQSAGQRATVMVIFGRDGVLSDYKIICDSKKLEKALEAALKKCPVVVPTMVNGEPAKYSHSFPLQF